MTHAPWLLALAGLVARGIIKTGWWLAGALARVTGHERYTRGYPGP